MRFYFPIRWRTRWCTALVILAFVSSIAFGGAAIRADDPATAMNQNIGTLNGPPPSGAAAAPSNDDVQYEEGDKGGNGNGGNVKNIVKVVNKTDNRLRVKGKIQLNHIPGANAQPENDAEAYSSCTNCSTFAVALQVDLISKAATTIAPKNVAIALNVQCSHCTTVAKAVQYVVQVDDPSQTPDNVKDLIGQMQQQLNAAARNKDETVADAEAKIDAVIAQFNELGQSLYTQRDQKDDDNTPDTTVPPDAVVLTPAPDATTPTAAP